MKNKTDPFFTFFPDNNMSTIKTNREFEKELCRLILKQMAEAPARAPRILNVHYTKKKNPNKWLDLSPDQEASWNEWRPRVYPVLMVAKFIEKAPEHLSKQVPYRYVITPKGRDFDKQSKDEQIRRLDEMWNEYDVAEKAFYKPVTTADYVKAIRKWLAEEKGDDYARKRGNAKRFLAEYYPDRRISFKDLNVSLGFTSGAKDALYSHFGSALGNNLGHKNKYCFDKTALFLQDNKFLPDFKAALAELDGQKAINLEEWKSIEINLNPKYKLTKPSGPGMSPLPAPGPEDILEETIAEIEKILARKKQVVLYGPPGTGKTWMADKYVEARYPDEKNREKYVRRCTFHPEYGYEHFIEGYRPKMCAADKQLGFELEPGIFKELCDEAGKEKNEKFYLIVDEINRGDIPRIFGELITLIETDKRGKSHVKLPHSKDKFSVPPNVYIIATMNTADRSIALLDTALRRRFGFLEMEPESSAFGEKEIVLKIRTKDVRLKEWFDKLNETLLEALDGRHDAKHILIGHSYFMPVDTLDAKNFEHIIRYEIYPLVEEYCYEDPGALGKILKYIEDTTVFFAWGGKKKSTNDSPTEGGQAFSDAEDSEEEDA